MSVDLYIEGKRSRNGIEDIGLSETIYTMEVQGTSEFIFISTHDLGKVNLTSMMISAQSLEECPHQLRAE